jgi:hypothetical protein
LGPGESLFLWDNDTLDRVIGKMLWRDEWEEKVALAVGIEEGFLCFARNDGW